MVQTIATLAPQLSSGCHLLSGLPTERMPAAQDKALAPTSAKKSASWPAELLMQSPLRLPAYSALSGCQPVSPRPGRELWQQHSTLGTLSSLNRMLW